MRLCGAAAAKLSRATATWAHQMDGVMKANTLYARFAFLKVPSLFDLIYQTDMKRARFRADSTPYDDKLASCERLRCHRPPLSSLGATYSGANKRRRALIEDADNEDTLSSADGSAPSDSSSNNMIVDESTPAPKPKRSRQSKLFSKADSGKDDGEVMDVDSTNAQIQVPVTPKSAPRPRRSRKSVGTATIPGARSKPRTPLVSSFTPPSPPADDNSQPQPDKAKVSLPLPRAVVEITTASDGSPRLGMSIVVDDSNTYTHCMQIVTPK